VTNQAKAQALNRQYESVFTKEDLTTIPEVDSGMLIPDMLNIQFSVDGTAKLLQRLNPSKANGPDKIPTRVLKECADVIALYLTPFSSNPMILARFQEIGPWLMFRLYIRKGIAMIQRTIGQSP
jgi:hypothetical protein